MTRKGMTTGGREGVGSGGPNRGLTEAAPHLGGVEAAIVRELQRVGGPVPRRLLVSAVLPGRGRRTSAARSTSAPLIRRGPSFANLESSVSRALRSLERKGLIVRTFSRPTKQALVSLASSHELPAWEVDARVDEAFALRCGVVAARLGELGDRARRRATRLRVERNAHRLAHERVVDRAEWRQLLTHEPVRG
jgi:hypothetical protein